MEKLSDDDEKEKTVIKPKETQKNTLIPTPAEENQEDEVLNRLDEISKAKPIKPEPRQPIEKQIRKPKVEAAPIEVKQKEEPPKVIEDNPNAFDEQDEFYDFESKKVARDTELVTMLVFDEIGPIVGVDEKVYGPFRPQDLVTLPLINAKVFFKNRKGRQVKI